MATQDKIALITGSSSGIGLEIAKTLSNNNYKVILQGIEPKEKILTTLEEFNCQKNIITYKELDLSNIDAVKNWCKDIEASNLSPDVVVNNAGFQHVNEITNFNIDIFEKMLKVNLLSAFVLMHYFLKNMQEKKWGRIINIASAHGLVASIKKSAYVASKHGLIGLTKVAALENAKNGITCNAICPGWVLTDLVIKQIELKAKDLNISFDEAKQQLLSEKQPSGEFVTPNQIAEFILFLLSDSASQINGASLSIDGAWTAQ